MGHHTGRRIRAQRGRDRGCGGSVGGQRCDELWRFAAGHCPQKADDGAAARRPVRPERLPLINDAGGNFYFKGESDRSIWLSPHDEIDCEPCDAAATELDVATAIERFEGRIAGGTRRADLGGAPDLCAHRLPVYGFDSEAPGFCAGQGGFGSDRSRRGAVIAAIVGG